MRLRRRLDREREARLEAEAIAERFTRAATHDPLTGLANRGQLLDRLDQALLRRPCLAGQVGVLFVDLDDFKQVNDRHGHHAGDAVLRTVGERLRAVARASDSVGRLGGDEFVVLCDWAGSLEEVLRLADRVQQALAAPVRLGEVDMELRASIGVRLAVPGETAERVLRDADAAMYAAKAAGKGRAALHDGTTLDHVARRSPLAAALAVALDQDAVDVWFQPVVRLTDGTLTGVEALARWHHPDRGFIPPDEFVLVAEAHGLIGQLDRNALRRACRYAAAAGFGARDLTLSVNASVPTLEDPGYVRDVTRTLRGAGLSPRSLTVEITERSLAGDNPVLHENLAGLRALGVRLAIDDFGQEYSSFAYLRRLPVDVLKIDRSFIAGVGLVARDEALVGAIVGVARALGMRTIAEGVETTTQAAALRHLGADQAQGWHFGRPAPFAATSFPARTHAALPADA